MINFDRRRIEEIINLKYIFLLLFFEHRYLSYSLYVTLSAKSSLIPP